MAFRPDFKVLRLKRPAIDMYMTGVRLMHNQPQTGVRDLIERVQQIPKRYRIACMGFCLESSAQLKDADLGFLLITNDPVTFCPPGKLWIIVSVLRGSLGDRGIPLSKHGVHGLSR